MMEVGGAIQNLKIASDFGTEISSEESSALIIKDAIVSLNFQVNHSERKITEFNDFIIGDFPSVSETINSGYRGFDDFLKLLEKAEKFKGWINGIPHDSNIVKDYIKAGQIEDFTNNSVFKTLKFLLVSVPLDFLPVPIIGATAEAAIDVLIDKMRKWKPNQFVENDLSSFVKQ